MNNQFLDDVKGKHIVGYDDLEQSYTREQSRLVSEILKSYNYFDVLGITWEWPTTKEINNAYTKLSEKVHPNNNKAPGSEEAFKKVEEAYECLSHTGKYLRHTFLHRLAPGVPNLCEIILAMFLFGFIISYFVSWITNIPSPPYLLELNNHHNYSYPIMTHEYGINFYVKSLVDFDEEYPVGTSARAAIENKVINDYIQKVKEYCNDELRWHSVRREFPTPACDMLQTFKTHI